MGLLSLVNQFKPRRIIETSSAFDKLKQILLREERIAIDAETSSLDFSTQELVGIGIAIPSGHSWYIPFYNSPIQEEIKCGLSKVLSGKTLVGHNIKFDLKALKKSGIEFNNSFFEDTYIMAKLLDEQSSGKLERLLERYLGIIKPDFSTVVQKSIFEVSLKKLATYCRMDAKGSLLLAEVFRLMLESEKLTKVFRLEMDLIPVVKEMEYRGITINLNRLRDIDNALGERLNEITNEIFKITGKMFNIASPPQLREVFTLLGIKDVGFYTEKTLGMSTASPDLDFFLKKEDNLTSQQKKLIELILEYRKIAKLKSAYTQSILEKTKQEKILHANFNQVGTRTGRFSSSEPNLQNIPKEDHFGIRQIFVPRSNHKFIIADFNQCELRILAHFSKDEALLEAFRKGKDVHATTASQIFGKPISRVSPEERYQAKTLNFGIIYGLSPWGLARQLGPHVKEEEAKELIDLYFKTYTGVRNWIYDTICFCREKGYTQSLLGRRRRFPEINSEDRRVRKEMERKAVNFVIQGSNADITKAAMIKIFRNKYLSQVAHILIQVHDELIIEVLEGEIEKAKEEIKRAMEKPFNKSLRVDLPVDIRIENVWKKV